MDNTRHRQPDLRIRGTMFAPRAISGGAQAVGRYSGRYGRRRAGPGLDRDGERGCRLTVSMAIACSYCARAFRIDCRGLRTVQSCLCFNNGDLIANAGVYAARKPRCLSVSFHCVIEDLCSASCPRISRSTRQDWLVQSVAHFQGQLRSVGQCIGWHALCANLLP